VRVLHLLAQRVLLRRAVRLPLRPRPRLDPLVALGGAQLGEVLEEFHEPRVVAAQLLAVHALVVEPLVEQRGAHRLRLVALDAVPRGEVHLQQLQRDGARVLLPHLHYEGRAVQTLLQVVQVLVARLAGFTVGEFGQALLAQKCVEVVSLHAQPVVCGGHGEVPA